jgi:hypothetical protein
MKVSKNPTTPQSRPPAPRIIKPTVLLTGAGFTKSFGGYLADEMWATIFNQPEIAKYPKLRDCLLKTINFEDAYDNLLGEDRLSPEERRAFTDALGRAYDEMDGTIRKFMYSAKARCIGFISLFAGSGEEERGFIFTLNQDLFLERFIANGNSRTRVWIDMPGLDFSFWFSNNPPRVTNDIDSVTPPDEQQVTHFDKITGIQVVLNSHI